MAGYIGKSQGVTQVDGYNRTEADDRYVNASGDTMTGDLIVNANVGVGTSSPQDPLHVAGDIRMDNAGYIVSESNTGVGVRMLGINAGNAAYVGPIDSGPTSVAFNASTTSVTSAFYTGGTERMRIDASGNLLVGTTIAPGISGSVGLRKGSTGQLLLVANSGGLYHQALSSYYLVTTAGGSTSDATLKTNVTTLTGALDKVCAMRGVNFEFIEPQKSTPDNGVQIGVIAQEVEAQYPEAVVTNDDGIKSVRYEKLVAPLIEAIKEQQEIIASLKSRLDTLEGN